MPPPDKGEQRKFGTFGGVFTPNVLTILGVILFLRTGWVVGNAGLKEALIILGIANSITLLTSLSLSAIATNTRVGGGGAYFLISRSLGLEIGGSIGVPLFLAQAISVAFYIIGFTESLQFLWPDMNEALKSLDPRLDIRTVSYAVLLMLFIIAWVGADLAIKAQYFILAALGLSLVSFFAGWSPIPDWKANWEPNYTNGHQFWSVFAIFFPAVTGIMAGASMSGDLRNPAKSIPRGTLHAVMLTFVIYAACLVWLALNAPREELLKDTLVMKRIALAPALIYVGLWAATLSSALASLLAAPRTLQALGQDGVVPRFLARGFGPLNEPRIALTLSALIALGCLALGELNLIAPIITMFFLTTYAMVNLVAGIERLVSNPSYRPTFKVHWFFSLAGGIGCLFVMFLLNALATLVAVVFIFGLYSFLKRRHYRTAWGDVRSGFWFAVARLGLLQLSASRQHVRNWRPVILVLAGNPKTRLRLLEFAGWFESRRGLLFLAQIVTGDWQKLRPRVGVLQKSMEDFIQDNRLSAVAKTVLADDLEHGVSTLLQVAGVGPIQPNTVLIGWSDDAVRQAEFARTVRHILELEKNLLVYAESPTPPDQLQPCIDIWWLAKENGSLMLTLAHLLQTNNLWRDHKIRVLRIVSEEAGHAQTDAAMNELTRAARIETEVQIIVSKEPPMEIIARTSERSAVCFIGLAVHQLMEKENPLQDYAPLVARMKGNLFLTKSWHDLEL